MNRVRAMWPKIYQNYFRERAELSVNYRCKFLFQVLIETCTSDVTYSVTSLCCNR